MKELVMAAPIIQANYETLGNIAEHFGNLSQEVSQQVRQMRESAENLLAHGWEGAGSDAFEREMRQVFPRLNRLTNALHQSELITRQIIQLVQEAEKDASNVFKEDRADLNPKLPIMPVMPIKPPMPAPAPMPPKPVTPPAQPKPKPQPIVHTVVPGDTLWDISRRYGISLDELLKANPQIKNPDLIHPGNQITIPGTEQAPPAAAKPAPGLGNPTHSPNEIIQAIDSKNVQGNERYRAYHDGNPNTNDTYCNLFASDVAQALGAPLPIYVTDGNGNVTKWLGATMMKEWLDGRLNVPGSYQQGTEVGWSKVDAATASQAANNGYVTVAAGAGHMAVVRPGGPVTSNPAEVHAAQAGAQNFNHGTIGQGWGQYIGQVEFYVFRL